MKTLKISLVATAAATVGWWLGLPQRMWPTHPYLADVLLSLLLCLVLQFAWSEPKKGSSEGADADKRS